jgi:hypothetical protein
MPKPTAAPANGITAEVIRDCMKPYGFSPDLLEDFVASLPPPPPEASTAWRHRHLTRLVQEVAIFMPADDAQARLAADVVGMRELAGVMRRKAVAPGVTTAEQCRLSRTAADVFRAALAGERQLDRRQHMPAPFFGTLLSDPVSIGALDAVWRRGVGGTVDVEPMDPETRVEGGDPTALEVPHGMAGDPRVEPEDKRAAMTASLVVAGAGHGDTDSMDREAEGAQGDLAAGPGARRMEGDPRVEPADKRPAMKEWPVVGEAPGAGGSAGGDVDLLDREAEDDSGRGAVPAPAPLRAGVVVEQGDGWSLEVWPATANCAAAGDGAARKAAAGGAA